ncbi:hypothetical protein EV426DRAFT_628200 [Tirmania nivea]|nr:hypothetical protein EV426DRAFT_628200 [Tirmania nivea]
MRQGISFLLASITFISSFSSLHPDPVRAKTALTLIFLPLNSTPRSAIWLQTVPCRFTWHPSLHTALLAHPVQHQVRTNSLLCSRYLQ